MGLFLFYFQDNRDGINLLTAYRMFGAAQRALRRLRTVGGVNLKYAIRLAAVWRVTLSSSATC